jgi:hypothetical protein
MRFAVLGALFLSGLGSQIAGLKTWEDASSPLWVSGVLAMLGSVITAAYMRPPGEPPK